MKRPNIFNFAKNELTQDAIIAWLFECLNSEEKYKTVGENFIKLIFDNKLEQCEIELDPLGVNMQYYKMDIYAVIRINNLIYPIIVEDKTDTFIHGNQFESYCEKVSNWMKGKNYLKELRLRFNNQELNWGKLIYLYFKSGFVPNYEKTKFNNLKDDIIKKVTADGTGFLVREIYTCDMISFIESQNIDDKLLNDYYSYLKTKFDLFDESHRNALKEDTIDMYNRRFSNAGGCSVLFEKCFGKGTVFNNHLYQGWASKDIFTIGDEFDKNDIYYVYRFEQRAYAKGKYAYAFLLQQYRYEKETINDANLVAIDKIANAKSIQKICTEIINDMRTKVNVEVLEINEKKVQDSNVLLMVFIKDDNTPEKVCEFIKSFTKELIDKVDTIKEIKI